MRPFTFILFCSFLLLGAEKTPYLPDKISNKYKIISSLNCPQPLTWKIGKVDPRLNLDENTIKKLMANINELWSGAAGQDLIAYSDSGRVTINFIYGKEQKITDTERELSKRIDQLKLRHLSLEHSYEQLFYRHQKKSEKYDQKLEEYTEKVESHNWLVRTRSDANVVQDVENERLIELKKKIKTLKNELHTLEEKLNNEAGKLARLSSQLDEVGNDVNKLVYSYNDQFGSARTFYQGIYSDDFNHQKINIYEFASLDKLRLVLAHEVGHALGLSHVSNPTSIMYFKMEYQNEQTLQLSEEDVKAIQKQCKD